MAYGILWAVRFGHRSFAAVARNVFLNAIKKGVPFGTPFLIHEAVYFSIARSSSGLPVARWSSTHWGRRPWPLQPCSGLAGLRYLGGNFAPGFAPAAFFFLAGPRLRPGRAVSASFMISPKETPWASASFLISLSSERLVASLRRESSFVTRVSSFFSSDTDIVVKSMTYPFCRRLRIALCSFWHQSL